MTAQFGNHRPGAICRTIGDAARVVDATNNSFVFEITGKTGKIEQFITLMQPLGLREVARTGIAAISRGPEAMHG